MASNVAQGSTRLILIGAAVLLSIGMGLRQSIGLFLTPVTRDLALTAADFTLTIAIQNIVRGLAQAPAGAIADRSALLLTLAAGVGGLRPGGAGAKPQQNAWCGRGGPLVRYAHRAARDSGCAEILPLANR